MENTPLIKNWLARTGRKKTWLASQLGVHPDTLSRWDNERTISKQSAMAVSVATGGEITLEMWGME